MTAGGVGGVCRTHDPAPAALAPPGRIHFPTHQGRALGSP